MKTEPKPKFPPRPGDLPRIELAQFAEREIRRYGGPEKCHVNFKFTCQHCGARCTLIEKNTLNEVGECCACHGDTPITHGGFSIHLEL
jgi:hypothetical protein